MSESPPTDSVSNKSPVVDKVAVACKHPGVFMETSELEAETGAKLQLNLQIKKPIITENGQSRSTHSTQEEAHSDPVYSTNLRRKKIHSRSKRKRFDRSKVTGYVH